MKHQLWSGFFEKVKSLKLSSKLFIYSHNLGSFDGYFIAPAIYNYVGDDYKNVNLLIDDQNKFITINYRYCEQPYLNLTEEEMVERNLTDENRLYKTYLSWRLLDSYRLFPISLNDFARIFGEQGKLSSYDSEWNKPNFLEDEQKVEEFKKYSQQDSISLLKTIINARKIYLENYNVDITKTVSSPSLSLLIYRHKFQKINIPIYKRNLDTIIRKSYFGGSPDY